MISKTVLPNIGSHRAINTDHAVGQPGEDVGLGHTPEAPDRIWVLDAIQYSYRAEAGADVLAAPIKGRLVVRVGDKIKWDADIPDFTGVLNLYIPGQADKDISVMLYSGGGGYIGKLNCQWHLEPSQ
jgi:hypothetical protein